MKERSVAYKIKICDLINSKFLKEGEDESYSLFTRFGNVSRVNVIGVVIKKDENEFYEQLIIDDNSGKIFVRSFEKNSFSDINVGDIVQVIGKIREFKNEKYVANEIIRKMDDVRWIIFRDAEIKLNSLNIRNRKAKEKYNKNDVLNFIKGLDKGDGVSFDDILKEFDDVQNIIDDLIKKGDVFEVRPGRIKILE